ncbi:MAG: T9SS type A sorting domain-containing protein [Candidatus Neomarinimicrobiota bacterium]|nr:T9SS type A sorting domain-containing protein [Candidatus Neomarinimicrobiota bacterium]
MVSTYLIACDSDQTDVGGTCYNANDLNALVAFASNSELSAEYEDVIGMGSQVWNADGKLTAFIWNNGDLKGAIPSEIGNLTALQSLFLSNNDLTGSIPMEIGNMASLTSLWLDGNSLTGSIPNEIGNLTLLSTLKINDNNLSGSIPDEIGSLTGLTVLWLNSNQLSSTLPSQIGNLSNLLQLQLQNNQLTGIIPSTLCNLTGLLSIDLSSNKFCENDANCSSILDSDVMDMQDTSNCPDCEVNESPVDSESCYNDSDLDVLSIIANNSGFASEYADVITLGDQDWNSDGRLTSWICTNCMISGPIPSEIGALSELDFLNLGGNSLTGTIPSEIYNLSKLTTIRLHDNLLSGSLPEALFSLIELTELNLHDNDFSGEISSSIENLSKLEILNLHNNNFSGNLPSEIGNLSQLNIVYLYENSFSGSVPEEFGNLEDTNIINLHKNSLSGLIPDSFCNLLSVNNLRLDQNNFCPPYPDCMTEEDVGTQDNEGCANYCESGETSVLDEGYIGCYNNDDLQFLEDLIANSAGVEKPPSNLDPWKLGYQTWNDTRLNSFCCSSMDLSIFPQLEGDLSNCDDVCPYVLNTTLPSSVGNLNQLDTLIMVGMGFEGTIPDELVTLTDLDVLFLTDNTNLTGGLPANIGNIQGLKHLNFKNNDLTGNIPASFWGMDNLISIDLENNLFSDILSNTLDFSDFSFLKWFNIGNNNFHGLIPNNICDLTYVNVSTYADNFEFNGNLFCPPFPDCITTSNDDQNSTFISYYEDANLNGFGNPNVVCAEQYCEDYPPLEGDCAGYVSDNTDSSDACPDNQLRDECGECGGDGFIANCTNGLCQNMDCNGDCKIGTLFECSGSNCGTAEIDACGVCAGGLTDQVINEDFDVCGICNGPNTDCSAGYDSVTCPHMDLYCGSCDGTSEVCLPRLDIISPSASGLVDINTNTIRFYFTAPVNYQSGGIEVESHDGTNINFTTSFPADNIIELILVEPLISNDQIEITINPCGILSDPSLNIFNSTYCLDANENGIPIIDGGDTFQNENMENIILNVALMADFEPDGDVDQYDLDALLQVWKTEDYSHELGPWTGVPPYLQATDFGYDGDYDIHDLMGFVQMWNWDYETNGLYRKMESNVTVDYDLSYDFIDNQMIINFEDYPGDIKRAWFRLNVKDSNVKVKNSVLESDFDVVFVEFDEILGIHDWVIGSFMPINDRFVNLFNMGLQNHELNSFVLEYEIIGFNGEVSNGEIDFTYDMIPEKIFVNDPYPNPYNPVTKIVFGIIEKSNVLMEIHDIQGRLIDEKSMFNLEAGVHEVIWDGSDEPSGIYLIRMNINDKTKKFRTMLIK